MEHSLRPCRRSACFSNRLSTFSQPSVDIEEWPVSFLSFVTFIMVLMVTMMSWRPDSGLLSLLRSLSNISQIIYQTSNPVDTQYVAANDPRVSTVAVVITVENKQEMSGMLHLMLVGRGYTSKGPGDIPPITTRRLFPVVPPPFSQEEELGKLVVGSYSEYNNHFVKAVTHGEHVYFLFSRRDMWHKKEYRTYASRLCASDRSFYSYVEVPLLCHGGYNLAQAAWLGNHSGEPALFVVMAVGQASTPVATGQSALCVYGMAKLDAMLRQAQEVCYTEGGRGSSGQEEAYIEYAVSSKCLKLPKVNTPLTTSPSVKSEQR